MADNLSQIEYESILDERISGIDDSLDSEEIFELVHIYEEYAYLYKGKKKYFDTCINLLKALSNEDDNAMLILGHWYYNGFFVDKNYDKALEYYEKSASYGNDEALVTMGKIYYYGYNGEPDLENAFKCFVPVALKDNEEALYLLGDMYLEGDFVDFDDNEAFDLYEKAESVITDEEFEDKIDLHAACIYYRLAKCYYEELGVDADLKKAMYYASLAEGFAYLRKEYKYPDNKELIEDIKQLKIKINKVL